MAMTADAIIHAILFGSIEFVAFDTLTIGGRDLGPRSIWVMSFLNLLNLLFIGVFYKELKLTTFDPGPAAALGFSPVLLHCALMFILSLTSVGAFSAVGAVLVVALVIVLAATAYLLTDRLAVMIPLSVVLGAVAALAGYHVAIDLDAQSHGPNSRGLAYARPLVLHPRCHQQTGPINLSIDRLGAGDRKTASARNHAPTPGWRRIPGYGCCQYP